MFKKTTETKKINDKNTKEDNKKSCVCPPNNNLKWIFVFIIVVIIAILAGYIINQQRIRAKTEMANELKTFIDNHLINEEQKLELVNIEEISGLYRMNFELDNNPIKLYMTKDGKFVIFENGIRNLVEFKAEMQTREERNREEREWREKSDQFQATLTPERKEKIAKCLTKRGFRVYIAEWCPVCRQQKELFGEAAQYLTSIDCVDPNIAERNLAKCPDIQGVPAWKDGEGNMLQGGMLDIKRLVQLSGCNY